MLMQLASCICKRLSTTHTANIPEKYIRSISSLTLKVFFICSIFRIFKQYRNNIDNRDEKRWYHYISEWYQAVPQLISGSLCHEILRCSLSIAAEAFPGSLLPAETTSEPSLRDICRQQVCPPDMTVNSKKKHPSRSTVDEGERKTCHVQTYIRGEALTGEGIFATWLTNWAWLCKPVCKIDKERRHIVC